VGFNGFVPAWLTVVLLWRGGERGGELPAARRHRGTTTRTAHMDLLAAEITPARQGSRTALPGADEEFGAPCYTRIDAAATPDQKARLAKLSPDAVKASTLAGEPITAKLTRAPGNQAPIGGLKVVAASGCSQPGRLAPRTSTRSTRRASGVRANLEALVSEAQEMVNTALGPTGDPSPLPPGYRASGVLLHVTSLPSPLRHR